MSALAGKRIVVTRAPHQAGELADLLRQSGAVPLLYPCIDIAPPDDLAPLEASVRALSAGGFDWLILTSANTVLSLQQRFDSLGLDPSCVSDLQLAAIGTSTAAASEKLLGLRATFVPEDYQSASLVDTIRLSPGARVLLPQSNMGDDELARRLKEKGATVTRVEAYRTVRATGGVDLPRLMKNREVDAITFTSPSTVGNMVSRLAAEGEDTGLSPAVPLACIGGVTAAEAQSYGLPVAVVAQEHTLKGLVAALEGYFAEFNGG